MKGTSTHFVKRRLLILFTCLLVGLVSFAGLSVAGAQTGQKTGAANESAPALLTCPGTPAQCFADVPPTNTFFENANRLYMQEIITGYPCGGPGEPCDAENRPYYRPVNDVTRQQMTKFVDLARRLPSIYINTSTEAFPVYVRTTVSDSIAIDGYSSDRYGLRGTSAGDAGINGYNTAGGYGVEGVSTNGHGVEGRSMGTGHGVEGISPGGYGVRGESGGPAGINGYNTAAGYGVEGVSINGYGVRGLGNSQYGAGVYGVGNGANGHGVVGVSSGGSNSSGIYGEGTNGSLAAYFVGNAAVTGNLSKGGGSFKIDHPLEPADKFLYHSFVESPDMMNVYNGNVTTDANGDATVQMPDWFDALNRDFRYQLTPLGQFAQAMVSSKIKDNQFSIKTDKPNVEVSWQITGIRQDAYANANRIPVEEDKPADQKGKYLHPIEMGQPASSGIDYDTQQRLKESR